MIELAIEEEAELKTVTNVAEQAAHRASRTYGNRGNPVQPPASTSLVPHHTRQRTRRKQAHGYGREANYCNLCHPNVHARDLTIF
jgi:hypothetical protein